MKRLWRIYVRMFVLLLAISSLLAPIPALCAPHAASHACCAHGAQLGVQPGSPSCCPDAAALASLPMQPVRALSQMLGGSAFIPQSFSYAHQLAIAWSRATFLPSILLPTTILRT